MRWVFRIERFFGSGRRCAMKARLSHSSQDLVVRFKDFLLTKFAVAILLLSAVVGFLGRDLRRILPVGIEHHNDRIASFEIALPPAPAQIDAIHRVTFLDNLFLQLRALPGIVEVGGASCVPLAAARGTDSYRLASLADLPSLSGDEADPPTSNSAFGAPAQYCAATSGYFRTLRIPLLRGRLWNEGDLPNSTNLALINESLARRKWPGQNPLGRRIEIACETCQPRLLTVVGVVGDAHAAEVEATAQPTIYVSYKQQPQTARNFTVVMRSEGEANSLALPSQTSQLSTDSKLSFFLDRLSRPSAILPEPLFLFVVRIVAFCWNVLAPSLPTALI
jgi:hypothetical protein